MKKGSTMRFRKLSCFIICVLLIVMSACSNGVGANRGTIELKDYIDTPITGLTAVIEDIYDVGATDGTEYTNGAVRISATFDSDDISAITISAKCNYSLYGVTFGMDIDEADTIAYNECISQTQDSEYSKTYVVDNDCHLYIQSRDGKMVTEVQLTNYDANPNNGKGGLDYNDSYYDSDENEYFNPDEFYIDYDLSNIGFYDMMGYYDWCKLQSIRYSDGKGYVDINPNNGKYHFSDGYCMYYSFNTKTLNYEDAYTRIFRCDIVNNDSAILVPQDSGNYIKHNLQIMERSVFNNNKYVHMIISDRSSEGPYIPYEFVDWSTGEKTTNDNGDIVYRFKLL